MRESLTQTGEGRLVQAYYPSQLSRGVRRRLVSRPDDVLVRAHEDQMCLVQLAVILVRVAHYLQRHIQRLRASVKARGCIFLVAQREQRETRTQFLEDVAAAAQATRREMMPGLRRVGVRTVDAAFPAFGTKDHGRPLVVGLVCLARLSATRLRQLIPGCFELGLVDVRVVAVEPLAVPVDAAGNHGL